jgi:hypothetical protein
LPTQHLFFRSHTSAASSWYSPLLSEASLRAATWMSRSHSRLAGHRCGLAEPSWGFTPRGETSCTFRYPHTGQHCGPFPQMIGRVDKWPCAVRRASCTRACLCASSERYQKCANFLGLESICAPQNPPAAPVVRVTSRTNLVRNKWRESTLSM